MSKAQTSTRGSEIKRKQLLLLGGAVAIFTVVALGATYLFTKDAPKREAPTKPPEPISLVTGGSAYSEKEAWRTQLGSDVANMQKQFQEFTRQQQERDRERDEAAKKAAAGTGGRDLSPPVRPGSTPQEGTGAAGQTTAAATTQPPPLDLPPPPKRPKGNGTGPIVQGGGAFDPPAGGLGGSAEKSAIGSVSFDDPKKSGAGQNVDGESGGMFEKQAAGNYITAGTFGRAVLLNGLDAPTGGQAQSNPSPVLLRLIEPVTLPNGYKVDLKDCVITGNGMGVIESERATIRLDRLSCVDAKGGAIDLSVRGYVAGEDGNAGMRGKLISKTGQMLANALLASVGSGIGEAFKSSSETTSVSGLGTATTTTNPGEGFQRGFGSGTQRAFDMLAKYYIQLAEKTFPIVEVRGGRVVDVVFSKGFLVEGR